MRQAEPAELGFTLSELSHVIRAYRGMRGVDIIHDHTMAGPLYPHRPASVPVVTTIHCQLTPSAVDVYRAIGKTASIVAISRDQVSHAPDVPVARVIHHGMDLAAVPTGSGQGGYACFVGRMSPDKGPAQAIAIARKAGIPLRLAAKMREPEEMRYFREVIEPLMGPNEEFIGELANAEKYALMGEAFAFLNPIQWSEPFGLVMIEALATGTPVSGHSRWRRTRNRGSRNHRLPGLAGRAAGFVAPGRRAQQGGLPRIRCGAVQLGADGRATTWIFRPLLGAEVACRGSRSGHSA